MERFLRARERPLIEIFTPEFQFQIPGFQRPYAWTEEEAGLMLSDVQAALADWDAHLDEAPPYFFGSIVIVKSEHAPRAIVVDGQQRLTTMTILLAVLRDLDPTLGERLQKHILFPTKSPVGRRPVGPLRPRPADTRFFYDHIQRVGGTDRLAEDLPTDNSSQTNMLTNALFYRRLLGPLTPRDRRQLSEFMLRKCYVVEIAAAHDDQAYKIFTVIHDRGLDLKENDILKAEILGRIPVERQDYYADQWDMIEGDLGRDDFTELFSHMRMIKRPGKARNSLTIEIREVLDPAAAPERFMEEELFPKALVFQNLRDAAMRFSAKASQINGLLRILGRVRHRDWMPPAIAFFCKERRRPDDALAFLKALERLAYAFFIQAATDNERIGVYKHVIEAIEAGAPVEQLVARMDLTENQKQTVQRVLNGAIYNKERIRLPVLLRIDEWLADRGAWYDLDEVTVEHVLPRNPPPNSPWLDAFPDARQRKRLTDKLGNLALLSRRKNNQAGNLPFEQKKAEYFARDSITSFALTTQVMSASEWTPRVIEERHEQMLSAAREIWGL